MAASKTPANLEDFMTFAIEPKQKKEEITVTVFLPRLEEEGNGIKVDQYERVTIANEEKEETYMVLRGERVDVPLSVFVILKQKYPDL